MLKYLVKKTCNKKDMCYNKLVYLGRLKMNQNNPSLATPFPKHLNTHPSQGGAF